jgi:hypothetical protein
MAIFFLSASSLSFLFLNFCFIYKLLGGSTSEIMDTDLKISSFISFLTFRVSGRLLLLSIEEDLEGGPMSGVANAPKNWSYRGTLFSGTGKLEIKSSPRLLFCNM